MDCYIDIDLVHCEIKTVAFAGIWSSERLLKIAWLLGARQPGNSLSLPVWHFGNLFALGRLQGVRKAVIFQCYPIVPRDLGYRQVDVVVAQMVSPLLFLLAVDPSPILNDQHKSADFP